MMFMSRSGRHDDDGDQAKQAAGGSFKLDSRRVMLQETSRLICRPFALWML